MGRVRKQPRPSYSAAVAGSSTTQLEPVFPGTCVNSSLESEERDWAQLFPELVSKIGDHLLQDDATEYIRMRDVCQPWRRATVDPSVLEPRFFPRNWLLLVNPGHNKLKSDVVERFVNVRTGASLQIRLPTPEEYDYLGNTEGLLILHHDHTDTVCLLNPLTMAFTDLPSMAALAHLLNSQEFNAGDIKAAGVLVDVDEEGRAQSSQLPNIVVSMTSSTRTVLLFAKPKDIVWGLIDTSCIDGLEGKLPLIKGGICFRGKFYIPTRSGDVLNVVIEPQPHLTFVARQTGSSVCSGLSETSYILSSGDDRMLLVRKKRGIQQTIDMWDVDLENRRLTTVTALSNMTVILPSITLRSSTFPAIVQNAVCLKNYLKRLIDENLI